jgi:signal transduction histidine kinase
VLQSNLKKTGDQNAAGMLQKMEMQVNKLIILINDLLDATKIEGGKLQFNEEYFSIDKLIDEIIEEVQRTTEKHTIIKENVIDKNVFADKERIGQVLINFLTNAIKYSPYTEKIIIRTSTEGNTITCCVQDFGIGIASDKTDKIFERFFRASENKLQVFPGIGLGLYISSEIIKRQKGRIWVNSKEGKGSTFCFSLPLPTQELK